MHLEDLVGLAEAVPGAVVAAVDVDSAAVGFDSRVGVLELDVLVAHEGPGGEAGAVQGQGAAEVVYGFFVLGEQRVVVADDDAGFGAEFVGGGAEMGEEGEFGAQSHDVEDVGVVVEGVEAMGVEGEEAREVRFGRYEVFSVVGEESEAGQEKGRGWEDAQELV